MSEKERISMNNFYRPNTSGNNGNNSINSQNGRKINKNRNKKYSSKNQHRHLDENEIHDFHNLVSWRSSTTGSSGNHPSTFGGNGTRSHSSNKSSSSSSSPSSPTSNPIYLPHKTNTIHHNHQQLSQPQPRHHHQTNSHHSRQEKYYPESKSNYHVNYNKIPSYSFSIELTEYDFEEINQLQNYEPMYTSNCLDDELEIYLKSVYAKSEAALDLHAQHLALAAERSKQTATERWLLSRTPEERHRYLQSRNMATQF